MAFARVQQDSRNVIEVTGIILVAVIGIVPLAIAPALFLELALTPKLAVAFLGVGCLLVRAEAWWPGVQGLARTKLGRVYLGLLIAQALSLLVSTAFAGDWQLALFGTTSRRFGAINQIVIIFLTVVTSGYCYLRREVTSRLLSAIEVAGGLTATYGILQYFGWDPLQVARTYNDTYNAVRVPATFGHAIVFANFLLPVVLIAGSAVVTKTRVRWQWVHGLILVTAATAIVLSGTRSALLGGAAGAMVLFYFRGKGLRRKKALMLGAGGVIFALLLGLFVVSPAGEKFRVRIAQWSQDKKGGTRLLVWRDALGLVRGHWLVGVGPEAFGGEFRKVQSVELSNAFPDTYNESPHNLFLEVAVCQGLIGFSVLISLLTLASYCGFRESRAGDTDASALLASLWGALVSLQFAPLAFVNVLYLYLFAGLLLSSTAPPPPLRKIVPFPPAVKGPVLAGAAVLMAAGSLFVVQDLYFAQTARRLGQLDLTGAMESYGLARRFPLPGDELWCSRQLAILARRFEGTQREEFLAAARRASGDAELGAEDTPAAYYQSAALALLTGDLARAEVKLREAVELAPNWYRPRAMLANILMEQGRIKESGQEEQFALQCAGTHGDEIRETLRKIRESRPSNGSR